MFLTCLSLVFMAFVFFILGFLMDQLIYRIFAFRLRSFDSLIMAGLCFCGVYAEIFSIFAGVGAVSLLILLLLCVLTVLIFPKSLKESVISLFKNDDKKEGISVQALLFLVLFALIFISAVSASIPQDYDTYLYHIQAIKWIEKYGLVKGLANLHLRFGYNSAFLCLQALFSFSFTGHSFHQANGFICLVMLVYALKELLCIRKRSIRTSDLIRLSMVFYIVYSLKSISSPGTDIFPMLTMLYIFSKWCDVYQNSTEKDEEYRTIAFGLLAVLAVYTTSAKLSVAPVVLTAFYPVYKLIKKGRFKELISFVIISLITSLPYFIRNILISGYLVYPLESLDLFGFDWKVPAERAAGDRIEIGVYAKSLQGLENRPYSFREWLQVWFRELELIPRVLFVISAVLLLISLIMSVRRIVKKSADSMVFLNMTGAVVYLYWFFMAPNMRFGIVNPLLISALTLGSLFSGEVMALYFDLVMVFLLYFALIPSGEVFASHNNLIYPDGYKSFEVCEIPCLTESGKEVIIYKPLNGDQAGNDVFPESPTADNEYVMLRGEDIKEGFKACVPRER